MCGAIQMDINMAAGNQQKHECHWVLLQKRGIISGGTQKH